MESMALVGMYRTGQKKQLLQRVLSHSLAKTIKLFPRFGSTLYFEFPITNPYSHEERFCIQVEDSELRIVTDLMEWKHLRQHCRPCCGEINTVDPNESELFDISRDVNGATIIQILLLPHETFYVPFTYLTLLPYKANVGKNINVNRDADESKYNDADEESKEDSKHAAAGVDMQRRVAVRFISGSHGHIIMVLNIEIFPRPFTVHRVMRHYDSGNTVIRREIQLLGYDDPTQHIQSNPNQLFHESPNNQKFVHCVENGTTSKVMVEWSNTRPTDKEGYISEGGNSLYITFRYRCDSYPSSGKLYVYITLYI